VRGREKRYDEVDKICAAFSQENVFFFDKNLCIEQVADHVEHIVNDHEELDGIMLDYLQIIPSSDDKDGYLKMKNLVNRINEITRRKNIFGLSACQMGVEDRDKDMRDYMRMTRVREAKDIFHSCALFLGLHNDTQFRSMQFGDETVTDCDKVVFSLLKNKTMDGIAKKNINGELDRLHMKFSISNM
jgi:replicative DNA helicase